MLHTARWAPWHGVRADAYLATIRGIHKTAKATTTLAIETSCDDTSVAVISVDGDARSTHHGRDESARCVVKYHRTITAQSQEYNGIHPLIALKSHQANLSQLVREAREQLQDDGRFHPPTFISATRGPGIRSCLMTGLMMAKGLSAAWDVPLVGVHHMQAHALTPRLCSAMAESSGHCRTILPRFPYLTVLVSGGHTMLLQSKSLVEHEILAETQDIAVGDCLDKAARAILPSELFVPPYGKALEQFAFPNGPDDYSYLAPRNRQQEMARRVTEWKWSLRPPLSESGSIGKSTRRMIYTFSGLLSSLRRLVHFDVSEDGSLTSIERPHEGLAIDERREMAREILRLAFEHLASRILLHFTDNKTSDIDAIVISGGVASNRFLRHVLRQMLDARGLSHIQTVFPPPNLCTDNALMIAWAGMEMFRAGYTASLKILPIRKWSMDSKVEGGILGADGWVYESRGI